MKTLDEIIEQETWTRTTESTAIKLESDNFLLLYNTANCQYELYQKIDSFLFHPKNKIVKWGIREKGCKTLTL